VTRYDHTYLRTEKLGDDTCDVIESKPKDDKIRDESGYSRKVIWLDATSHVERKVEYYDLSGKLLKTQRAFDIQQIEPSRSIPLRREMINNQTGHKTLYQLEHITRDRNNEELFTVRNLERM
jgi:negative regulator of sigma E activity